MSRLVLLCSLLITSNTFQAGRRKLQQNRLQTGKEDKWSQNKKNTEYEPQQR